MVEKQRDKQSMSIEGKTFNLLINLFVFTVVYFLFNIVNLPMIELETMAIIAMVIYAWIICSFIIQVREFNFYIIFVVLSFFFYFGQHFILLCGGNFNSISRSILGGRLPIESLTKTGIFIIESMLLLHIGYLISDTIIWNNTNLKPVRLFHPSQNSLIKIGLIMLSISMIPNVVILVRSIMTTIHFGYGSLFETEYHTKGGFHNVLKFLSLPMVPSLYLLLIAYRGTKKVKYISCLILLYSFIYLMTGSRMSVILMFLTLILIKHYWFSPIKLKHLFKYFMVCFIFVLLMSAISAVRNQFHISPSIYSLIRNTLNNIWINNPFFVAIEETGFTFLATATVITYCPSVVPYNLGMSYVNSIYAIFPNLFWDVHPAATNTDMVFKKYFTSYGGMGSSFIAEAYYNFGEYSLLIMPIFGWLLGYLCRKTKNAVKLNSPAMFYLCMYVSSIVFIYVRSDTVTFWRNFIYYGAIPIVIASISSKSRTSNNIESLVD